uniref:Uncharacterized protein n=1 Tax=Oryza rufipogon TaxID=4529 RepID=A0A0E0RJN9_ORYRU
MEERDAHPQDRRLDAPFLLPAAPCAPPRSPRSCHQQTSQPAIEEGDGSYGRMLQLSAPHPPSLSPRRRQRWTSTCVDAAAQPAGGEEAGGGGGSPVARQWRGDDAASPTVRVRCSICSCAMLLAWLAGRLEEYLWEVGSGVGKAAAVAARWRWRRRGGLGGDPLKAEGEHGGGGGGLDLEVVVLAEDVLCYGLDVFGAVFGLGDGFLGLAVEGRSSSRLAARSCRRYACAWGWGFEGDGDFWEEEEVEGGGGRGTKGPLRRVVAAGFSSLVHSLGGRTEVGGCR